MRESALIVFGLLLALQIGYLILLRIGWERARRRFPDRRPVPAATAHLPTRIATAPDPDGGAVRGAYPAISVIVAARDEEARIGPLLAALKTQTHTRFEAIVIDDASVDGTADLVRAAAAGDVRFRLVQNPDVAEPRKKRALRAGITAARYDAMAFTDADCTPPPGWLDGLAHALGPNEDPVFVVGIGLPTPSTGTLNALQRWDASLAAWHAAAAIGWGVVCYAKGSNLAYRRSAFDAVGGFGARSMSVLNGDDALLLHEVYRRGAARIEWLGDASTIVSSPSPGTVRLWVRQKIRHTSGSRYLPVWLQLHLAVYHGSATLLWLAPLLTGFPGLALLSARLLALAVAAEGPMRHLGTVELIARSPLLDFLHAVFHALVPPVGFLRGARRW